MNKGIATRKPAAESRRERQGVGTLARGIKLLTALGNYPDGVRLTDLSAETGFPISTAYRLLALLATYEFVEYNAENRLYSLGFRIFELSHRIPRVRGLTEAALPIMRDLAEKAANMVSLDILESMEMIVVERVEGPQRIRIGASIGSRSPVYSTASGKAVLAFLSKHEQDAALAQLQPAAITQKTITDVEALRTDLERTRRRGFAIADEENEEGVRAIGAPIISAGQRVVGGLSIAAPAFLVSRHALVKLAPTLKLASQQIARRLTRR